jgi:hypothetical protein
MPPVANARKGDGMTPEDTWSEIIKSNPMVSTGKVAMTSANLKKLIVYAYDQGEKSKIKRNDVVGGLSDIFGFNK